MSEHAYRVASRFPPNTTEHRVALYHDHIEDAIGPVPHDIIDVVLTLTRRHGETYPDYITRISNSSDLVAIAVKLADLEDNLERCRGLHGGNSKSGLEHRYRQAHALLSLHHPEWGQHANDTPAYTTPPHGGYTPQAAPENQPETGHHPCDCDQLRQTITDVLDAEIGDDAVALRQMLRDALNEPGPGTGAATETCPSCGGDAADNTFDRSLCHCQPNGVMHTRCAQCGYSLDGCTYDERTFDYRPVTFRDRLTVAGIVEDALDQFPNDPRLYRLIDAVRCCAEFPECTHVLAWVEAHDAVSPGGGTEQ